MNIESKKIEIAELSKKLERVSSIMALLLKKRTIKNTQPCDRYYTILKMFNIIRDKITILKNDLSKHNTKEIIINEFEEKRAIKEANVTSTTYERAQRILNKQIDERFKHR